MKRIFSGIWYGVHALYAKISGRVVCVENERVEEVPLPEENQMPTVILDHNSNPEGQIGDGEKPEDNIEDVEMLDTENAIAKEQGNSIEETCLSMVPFKAPPPRNTTQTPIRKQGKKRKWEPSFIESPAKKSKM